MRRSRRKTMLSASLIAVIGASAPTPGFAQPSPADRAQRATAYQNMRNCLSDFGRANQAGATDFDRVQIARGCAARDGKTFQASALQQGIELEHAGRYAEAAAAYQAHLNASAAGISVCERPRRAEGCAKGAQILQCQ
jgi:hypothetical protein